MVDGLQVPLCGRMFTQPRADLLTIPVFYGTEIVLKGLSIVRYSESVRFLELKDLALSDTVSFSSERED